MRSIERLARRAMRVAGIGSRHVDGPAASHHVYEAPGTGRRGTLVFLPGLCDSASALIPVLLGIRKHARRVLVIESAGHGLSGPCAGDYTFERHVESVTAVLDRELGEPAVIVGNSLGGATALRYAAARPERVRGLYLTSPGGAAIDDATAADLRRTFAISTQRDAHAFLARVSARRLPAAGVMAYVMRARARAPEVAALLGAVDAGISIAPEDLARLSMPITVLWGRAERLLPAASLAYFRAHLPAHASFVEPDGMGHCPHLDDPLRLTRLIAAFSRRVF